MAAKERTLSIGLAIAAMFASSSAVASIPRSSTLHPPAIDFLEIHDRDVSDVSADNAVLLHHAVDALIPPSPVESLSETRVWVSRLERPLFIEPRPLLSDGLQKASAAAWPEIASGPTVLTPDPKGYIDSANLYAFCGGDPVNCSDPRGEEGADIRNRHRDLARLGVKDREAAKRRASAAAAMEAENELHRLAKAEMIRQRRLGIDVKATDIVFYTPDGFHGVTASGQIVANPNSGAIEDQTASLVLTATGLKVASPAIATAFRAGGTRAAAPLVADEIAGAALGINPSLVATAPRTITNALEAQRALADLTRQVNADLAANPALAQIVLRPKEYAAGTQTAAAQYGNAVERLVAQRIAADPVLRGVFEHVGGRGKPDFTAFGRNFDITTETQAQVMRHMRRPRYGQELIVVTYERPANFTTFPVGQ